MVPVAQVEKVMLTLTVPLTIAPSAGLVNPAAIGASHVGAMTTVRLAVPLLPAESRALTVAVCVPPEAPVLFHASEIGPLDVVVVESAVTPSTVSVRVRFPAAAFSSQIVNHTTPLTVVPSEPGCVMNTRIVPCC